MTLDLATHEAPPHDATAASARIAGFTPAGTAGWPGRVATTVTFSGCDFRCPYCHAPHLVGHRAPRGDWTQFRDYLRRRRNWIHGVVVTGGEPTDDPNLVPVLDELAAQQVPVRLDTNGSHPELLSRIIAEGLVECVALDVKTTFDRYESATGRSDAADRVRESIRTVLDSGVRHEFRTTVFPGVIESSELPEIARDLAGGELYALQQFNPLRTLSKAARSVQPETARALSGAASACSRFLPTVVRGI